MGGEIWWGRSVRVGEVRGRDMGMGSLVGKENKEIKGEIVGLINGGGV